MSIESETENLKRTMFFICSDDDKNVLMIHYEKTTKSHRDWFQELFKVGSIKEDVEYAMNYYTRGCVIDNKIIFYVGNYNRGYSVSEDALMFGNSIAENLCLPEFSVYVGATRNIESCELTPGCLFYETKVHNTYSY